MTCPAATDDKRKKAAGPRPLNNVSYVTIPANAANRDGALVIADLLLDPTLQAAKADPAVLGVPTVLDLPRLPAADRDLFGDPTTAPTCWPIPAGWSPSRTSTASRRWSSGGATRCYHDDDRCSPQMHRDGRPWRSSIRRATVPHPSVFHPLRRMYWTGARRGSAWHMDISAPHVGDPAPDLQLPRIDGGITVLPDLQGRPVLVSSCGAPVD